MAKSKSAKDLLIEIGTEEIPANYLAYLQQDQQAFLKQKFQQSFDHINEHGWYAASNVKFYLTPRRFVIYIASLKATTKVSRETVYGPPADKAYDAKGQPTPMLNGFLKSKGIRIKDVKLYAHKGRQCVGFQQSLKPQAFSEQIEPLLRELFKRLAFPKLMWWDESSLRFPRPIRSFLCVWHGKVQKIRLDELVSGDLTTLWIKRRHVQTRVRSVAQYFQLMKRSGVILDADERCRQIERDIQRLTKKHKGVYRAQTALLSEVTFLSEVPVCISGCFDQTYSDLPESVLASSLSKSQRLFSVTDPKTKHLPYFVAVLDGHVQNSKMVALTIGAVLKAKLQDSHFFYQEDLKLFTKGSSGASGIKALGQELGNLIYLRGVGTLHDKVERLKSLAEVPGFFEPEWGINSDERQELAQAAQVAKLDLLTHMVGEFPELQGTIGGIYAKHAGFSSSVCAAVQEQYLPIGIDGRLPSTRLGAILSYLDKIDLLVACFSLGKLPTASHDPYALKRALSAIFRLSIAFDLNVSFEKIISETLKRMNEQGFVKSEAVPAVVLKLKAFYVERAAMFLGGLEFSRDLTQAVLATEPDRFLRAHQKLRSLSKSLHEEGFQKTLKVIQRTSNILKNVPATDLGEVEPKLFQSELEGKLHAAYLEQHRSIQEAIERGAYKEATDLYADAFFDILHLFFEKVLVNIDQPEVRRNRLSLLASLRSLYVGRVADLSKINVNQEPLAVHK